MKILGMFGHTNINTKNTNADLMCILLTNLAKNDAINKVLDFEVELDDEHKKCSLQRKSLIV